MSELYFRLPRVHVQDERGTLFKCLTGFEVDLPVEWGEVYAVTILPGHVRGRHYHLTAREFFTVIAGTLRLELYAPESGARESLTLRPEDASTIEIPAGVAHALINAGTEPVVVVAVSSHPYDPADAHPLSWEGAGAPATAR